MESLEIAGHRLGAGHPPLIIAELSGNHQQSLETALAMIDAAAAAGAQAIKLQTYTADTMTLPLERGEFWIDDPDNPWHGHSLHELYKKAYTPWHWHAPLFARAAEHGLLAFSTPFDASAVAFLETLEVPCYKIASFENTDLPLLRQVAATGKPIILSTGMASLAELDEAVTTLRQHGCRDLILLKCVSRYPSDPTEANLHSLPHLQRLFNCPVGLSDHSLGIGVAVAAVALGACLVEKHLVLDRQAGGVDAGFSLEPPELAQLVTESRRAWQALGQVRYGPTPGEASARRHRRSLYISRDLKAGDLLTGDNVRIIRPGDGLAPKYLEQVLGRTVHGPVAAGTPLTWDLLLSRHLPRNGTSEENRHD